MNNDNKMIRDSVMPGVPSADIDTLIGILSDIYSEAVNERVDFFKIPSVMLWGPPGVGKTQAVRQVAEQIMRRTGKTAVVTDVRLLLFNPIDLRGIPTANEDKTLAVWLRPQIFDMDASDDVVNILFLDEISAAPPSVQASAYQITLDRTIGEHKLPDNCIVIAAGNRITDRSVAYKMPKALANRLMHFEVNSSFRAWRKWALSNGIDEKVLGFLSFRPDRLMAFDSVSDDLAFATPRSWEMVSDLLKLTGGTVESAFLPVAGLVGSGVAAEFRSWSQVYDKLPDIRKIFDGEYVEIPKDIDVLYALVSGMAKYASEHRNDLDRIENSVIFASKLPPDFAAVLMKDYIGFEEGYRLKLLNIPEFASWMRTKGVMLNGIE